MLKFKKKKVHSSMSLHGAGRGFGACNEILFWVVHVAGWIRNLFGDNWLSYLVFIVFKLVRY